MTMCAETKVLLDAGLPLTPGKSESESPERGKHFRHQTFLIESGRRAYDLIHSRFQIEGSLYIQHQVTSGGTLNCEQTF